LETADPRLALALSLISGRRKWKSLTDDECVLLGHGRSYISRRSGRMENTADWARLWCGKNDFLAQAERIVFEYLTNKTSETGGNSE
jgi:hypothetical protein